MNGSAAAGGRGGGEKGRAAAARGGFAAAKLSLWCCHSVATSRHVARIRGMDGGESEREHKARTSTPMTSQRRCARRGKGSVRVRRSCVLGGCAEASGNSPRPPLNFTASLHNCSKKIHFTNFKKRKDCRKSCVKNSSGTILSRA